MGVRCNNTSFPSPYVIIVIENSSVTRIKCQPTESRLESLEEGREFEVGVILFHQLVLGRAHAQDLPFTRLLDLSAEDNLIQAVVRLSKVEDDIEFTNVVKELIEHLHVVVDGLQHHELVILGAHKTNKEERGVPLVNYLLSLVLDKVAHLLRPREHGRGHVAHDALLLLLVGLLVVELGQTDLALPANEKHELNL